MPPVVEPESRPKVESEDQTPTMFEEVKTRLQTRKVDKNVVLNVPIWGWTGNGKTTSLLTALHFCEPTEHALGFAIVSDTRDLTRLEGMVPEYRSLNLSSLALSTADRLRANQERFIDANPAEWPHATDEANHYLLALRSVTSTLAYVVFPDLRGGSYREVDDAARSALENAHACIILVNPDEYMGRTHDSKRYRDEISMRIEQCASASIPACVMVTKSDQYGTPNGAADGALRRISMIAAEHETLAKRIVRVSVVEPGMVTDGRPPPVAERNPQALVAAFVWTLDRALERPATAIRASIPTLQAHPTEAVPSIEFDAIPELRPAGDFSDSPGRIISSHSDVADSLGVVFLDPSGRILQALVPLAGVLAKPQFGAFGQVDAWPSEIVDTKCVNIGTGFMLGSRRSANALWLGDRGALLRRHDLSTTLASWDALADRKAVGVDDSGRLHLLTVDSGKLVQQDFITDFIKPTSRMTCSLVDQGGQLLVSNGETTEAVLVGKDGKFGARSTPNIKAIFNGEYSNSNRGGLTLGVTAANLVAAVSGHTYALPLPNPEFAKSIALAPYEWVLATVDASLTLRMWSLGEESAVGSNPDHSPTLPALPTSTIIAKRIVALTLPSGGWSVFRSFGLSKVS